MTPLSVSIAGAIASFVLAVVEAGARIGARVTNCNPLGMLKR